MKIDLSDKTYFELEGILRKEEAGDEIDYPNDVRLESEKIEYIYEVERALNKIKEQGYQFAVIFNAINNDTYADWDRVILLYELPNTAKEIDRMVENTYDGVWEPNLKTIEVYDLHRRKIR